MEYVMKVNSAFNRIFFQMQLWMRKKCECMFID